jgi:hypothetical protein
MKQKFLTIPCLVVAIALIIASCSKGPAGPTGPAGPIGAAGPAGSNGTPGATGATGTANVIYSAWLNVKYKGSDTTGWFAQITAPRLTDTILNKGAIKVYFNAGSDSANSQIVMTLPIDDIAITGAIINAYFQKQLITLVSTHDVSSDSLRGYHYYQYRYVLIPGAVTALPVTANGYKTGINWNDYKQVKQYLGLKD